MGGWRWRWAGDGMKAGRDLEGGVEGSPSHYPVQMGGLRGALPPASTASAVFL